MLQRSRRTALTVFALALGLPGWIHSAGVGNPGRVESSTTAGSFPLLDGEGSSHGAFAPAGIRVAISSVKIRCPLPRVRIRHRESGGIAVCVRCPPGPAEPMAPGAQRSIPFTICNCGPVTGRYACRLSDDEGWMAIRQETLEVAAGESRVVMASITAPPVFLTPRDREFVRLRVAVVGSVLDVEDCVVAIPLAKPAVYIALKRFEAVSEPRGIRLIWEPAGERSLSFHVCRREAAADPWSRLTDAPITAGGRGEFLDEAVVTGSRYRYSLESLDRTGVRDSTGEIEALFSPPARTLSFAAVSPSPFRDQLQLELVLPTAAVTSIRVFDVSGRRVRSLLNERWLDPGDRLFVWDARDDGGDPVGAGVYFIRAVVDTPAGKAETRVVRAVRLR